jgi:hypothetical protein
MPDQVNGLPVHVLLVHAVVVLLPLCAFLLVAAALVPRARARLGGFLPLLAAGCLVLVPLTTQAGEKLQGLVGEDPLVAEHAELGGQLLPWAIALLVLCLVVWLRGRSAGDSVPQAGPSRVPASSRGEAASGLLVQVAVGVLSVAVAVGTVVQVVRIGESGAKAVWEGVVQTPAT